MMSSKSFPALVDVTWLKENLARVTTLDASYHLASTGRDADAEFIAARILGARRFDIDAPGLADESSPFPHMLPSASDFGKSVRALGVRASKPVVVYSKNDNYFGASRAWWMFRVFGKKDIGVLHGGWDQWKGPVESGQLKSLPDDEPEDVFEAVFNSDLVRTLEQMVTHSRTKDATIVDVRSAERFAGSAAEPRPGQKEGHIPGSLSLPYRKLLQNGFFKSQDELCACFEQHGILLDQGRPLAITCGSGVSACNLALAMHVAGAKCLVSVFDGSWTEYSRSEYPVEKLEVKP